MFHVLLLNPIFELETQKKEGLIFLPFLYLSDRGNFLFGIC